MSNVVASEAFLGTACTLVTPGAPISYWVRFPQGYAEHWETDANQLAATLLVPWEQAADFLKYAMGYTTAASGGSSPPYFDRVTPLLCPLTDNLYLMSLSTQQIGVNGDGAFAPDPAADNWPSADWVEYAAVFGNRPYDVVDQAAFLQSPYSGNELKRYVHRRRRFVPKERRISGSGYQAAGQPIPNEPQFAPFYEFELIYTWHQVPEAKVPWTAIARCAARVNQYAFDAGGVGAPAAGYLAGDLLFKGTAGDLVPYRGPDEAWYYDVPYLFGWQPADGAGNGWNKIPNKAGGWDVLTTIAGGYPLYFTPSAGSGGAYTADFAGLFQPEP